MKIGDRVFVRGYIDEIRKDTVIIRNAGGYFGTIPSEVITGELPSAQPMRKKGRWIDTGSIEEWWAEEFKCSECGESMESILGTANYCPNCGAKMGGGDS